MTVMSPPARAEAEGTCDVATGAKPGVRPRQTEAWRSPAAKALIAAALGNKSTTTALANAVLELAKARIESDGRQPAARAGLRAATGCSGWDTASPNSVSATEAEALPATRTSGSAVSPARSSNPCQPALERRDALTPKCSVAPSWDIWRPVLSITFSAFIGGASALGVTTAALGDKDVVADYSLTADCWKDLGSSGKREYHDCSDPTQPHDDHDNSGGVNTKSVDGTQISDLAVLEDVPAPPTEPVLRDAVEPQPAPITEQPAPVTPPALPEESPPVAEAPVADEPVPEAPIAEAPMAEAPVAEEKTDTEVEIAVEQRSTGEMSSETAP